jgi:DNA invertase Pin-like site-specific DNA recombinase
MRSSSAISWTVEGSDYAVSVLNEVRALEQRVVRRLGELRPLIEEYNELKRVAERLGVDVDAAKPAPKPRKRTPTRRRRPAKTSRRSAGGTRAVGAERRARVIELVEGRPGITVTEISRELGVEPPPVYRVVRKLQADGVVKKEGKGLRSA